MARHFCWFSSKKLAVDDIKSYLPSSFPSFLEAAAGFCPSPGLAALGKSFKVLFSHEWVDRCLPLVSSLSLPSYLGACHGPFPPPQFEILPMLPLLTWSPLEGKSAAEKEASCFSEQHPHQNPPSSCSHSLCTLNFCSVGCKVKSLPRPFPWMVLIWFGNKRKGTWQNSYGVLFSLSQSKLGLFFSSLVLYPYLIPVLASPGSSVLASVSAPSLFFQKFLILQLCTSLHSNLLSFHLPSVSSFSPPVRGI